MTIGGSLSDLRRATKGHQRVGTIELFFDLVFVFAITQLSHALLADLSVANAARVMFLIVAVWWIWPVTVGVIAAAILMLVAVWETVSLASVRARIAHKPH